MTLNISKVAIALAVLCLLTMQVMAEPGSGSGATRVVFVVDIATDAPERSRRRSRSHEQTHQGVISFLKGAYELRFSEARSYPSIAQTWLVFDDSVILNEKQLDMIAEVHPQIHSARRTQFQMAGGNEDPEIEPENDPLQPNAAAGVGIAQRWSTGIGIRVAVVGTGADRKHPDIRERIISSKDFTGSKMRGFDDDSLGTAVASIIAGSRETGIRGVAPGLDLLILRACLQRKTSHYDADCDSVAIAAALDHAIQNDVQLLHLGFSGPTDPLLATLIDEAVERGIVVTSAWSSEPQFSFPSRHSGLVTAQSGTPEDGSAVPQRVLSLPGEKILVALPKRRYGTLSGNSASAALTTGVIALLLQRKPHMGTGVIVEQLIRSQEGDGGTINSCRAVGEAIGVPCTPTLTADLP